MPSFIALGDAYKQEAPKLEAAYRRYQEWGNPPSNWYGVTTQTSSEADSDRSFLEYLRGQYPDRYRMRLETHARADAYVHLVEEVSRRWRFAENYGPYVIHSVVRSSVTFGPNRLQGSSFLTKAKRFTLRFEVEPYAMYSEGVVEQVFPNALRPFHSGAPLPEASWTETEDADELELLVRVRNLRDLERFMPMILRAFADKGGLPMKRSRRDAHAKLGRDARWFYLHHCEGKTLDQIAEIALTEEHDVDSSAVHKAVAKVRWLLDNPEMRLS